MSPSRLWKMLYVMGTPFYMQRGVEMMLEAWFTDITTVDNKTCLEVSEVC